MMSATVDTEISTAHLHRSRILSSVSGLVHGVTRRIPGVGMADGNVGYSAPRNREDAWKMRQQWLMAAGLDARNIVVAQQMHGHDVALVTRCDAGRGAEPESRSVANADALVTDETGVVLMTLHADCMPILLCDPKRRVVATVHAGWRGTTADVAGACVRAMVETFTCDAADILVHLGPAIGGCCYEVGDDVANAWQGLAGDDVTALRAIGNRWHFDLAAANRYLLERRGISRSNIEASEVCTRCSGEDWFSHRGQGALTGRYAAFIALTDGKDEPEEREDDVR